MKAVLVVGGFGMTFIFSLLCESIVYVGYPHSHSYKYVILHPEFQPWSRLNTWHEVYVARALVVLSASLFYN